jgi:hypothetical protein
LGYREVSRTSGTCSGKKRSSGTLPQELEQATRNGFISISERQEEQDAVNARQDAINASVLQMVAARSTSSDGIDDAATAFSAMTASSAVKDRRIEITIHGIG